MKPAACALLLAICANARAEETPSQDGAADATTLDEVVVTAMRREQLARNVPLSMSTLTGHQLLQMGATKFDEYAGTVPGLSYVNCGCTQGEKYTFRGVATDGISSSQRPLTAVYFDETPITYANGVSGFAYSPDPELVDIDRVEVLRGPQGALFGANAMGGAIRVLPRAAELRSTSGFVTAGGLAITDGGGGFGTSMMLNLPIPDQPAALRGVAWYRYKDGFIDTDPLGQRDANDEVKSGVRLSGRFDPTESLEITARFAHQRWESAGAPLEDADTDTPHRSNVYTPEPNRDVWTLASVTLTHRLEGLRTIATTSYLRRKPYFQHDLTPFTKAAFHVDAQTSLHTSESAHELTQEVRLQNESGSDLEWIAGLFLQNQVTNSFTEIPSQGFDEASGGRAAAAGEPDNLGKFDNHTLFHNYALFGDLSYRLARAWELGVGARAYRIEEDFFTDDRGLLRGAPLTESGETTESGITPRASLQFQPTSRLSFYASAAKGFRPGGVNPVTSLDSDQCRDDPGLANVPRTFESDSLWSYELGAKTSWLERRLYVSTALFHIDWKNVQTQRLTRCGFLTFTDNSGRARNNGVELTITALLLPRLTLELDEAYTDARFAEDSPVRHKHSGDPLPDVPRNTFAFAATYAFSHPGSFLRVDYVLRGSTPNDFGDGSPPHPFAEDTIQAYALTHVRMVWHFGALETSLGVRNLFNRRGAFSREDNTFTAQAVEVRELPRTIAVGLRYGF